MSSGRYSWNLLSNSFGREDTASTRLLQINDKIVWFNDIEIIEYDLETNKTTHKEYQIDQDNMTKKPINCCCCLFPENNLVYLMCDVQQNDGKENPHIFEINPNSGNYECTKKKDKLPELGEGPACIVLHDKIHIFGENKDDNNVHLIYCPKKNKIVKTIKNTMYNNRICQTRIVKHKNRLYRLGGYNLKDTKTINTFMVSNIIKKDEYDNIEWTIKEKQNLPESVYDFGCIVYKNFILTFGGRDTKWNVTNKIYALNIENYDNGEWKDLGITCPHETNCLAILINTIENQDLLLNGYIRESMINLNISSSIPLDVKLSINEFYSYDNHIQICQPYIQGGAHYYSMFGVKHMLNAL